MTIKQFLIQDYKKTKDNFLKFKKQVHNKSGVALLTAIAALSLMTYLAIEVTYDTQVEYIVNAQNLNRVKAYYAARSGVDISLLRIKIFQTIQQKLGKSLPQNGMLDQIWQFPLIWPLVLPDGLNAVDQSQIKEAMKESLMDADFVTSISDEGSKIDITNLNSPSETLREITKKQLLALFENKIKSDEDFSRKYSGFRFDEVINSIADWMSNKNASLNGGDKKNAYRDRGLENFPPNRNFRTIQEIRLVKGMTDEFFRILEPVITIYGLKGINPNTATAEVLQSIDPTITKEIAEEVIKQRQDPKQGPFKDANAFFDFLEQKGARLSISRDEFPIVTENLSSFRIKSIGEYNGSKREIEVVTLNFENAASRISDIQKKVDDKKNPQPTDTTGATNPTGNPTSTAPGTTPPNNQNNSQPIAKGPPRIVYWNER